jgi:hypothetical protein
MVVQPRNDLHEGFHPAPDTEQLQEIRELNCLFLRFLQAAARSGADCLGLDPSLAEPLRRASSAHIERIAGLPRALFSLDLEHGSSLGGKPNLPRSSLAQTREALTLTVLLCAWNMSRRRAFQARMFLGLSGTAIRCLRTLPLSELHHFRRSPRLLSCAFPGAPGLWAGLLREQDTGVPRALTLIGLQPKLLSAHPDPTPPYRSASRAAR